MSKWLSKLKRLLISSTLKQSLSQNIPDKTQIPLSSNPQENLKKLNELFSDASDIVIRQFEIDYQVPKKPLSYTWTALWTES